MLNLKFISTENETTLLNFFKKENLSLSIIIILKNESVNLKKYFTKINQQYHNHIFMFSCKKDLNWMVIRLFKATDNKFNLQFEIGYKSLMGRTHSFIEIYSLFSLIRDKSFNFFVASMLLKPVNLYGFLGYRSMLEYYRFFIGCVYKPQMNSEIFKTIGLFIMFYYIPKNFNLFAGFSLALFRYGIIGNFGIYFGTSSCFIFEFKKVHEEQIFIKTFLAFDLLYLFISISNMFCLVCFFITLNTFNISFMLIVFSIYSEFGVDLINKMPYINIGIIISASITKIYDTIKKTQEINDKFGSSYSENF